MPPFAKMLHDLAQLRGIQYDLSRMEIALNRLGHPEQRAGIIHVAGTNGKGTTSDFIAQLLEQQGYRVGLYTSPHLVHYRERFRLNGIPITEADLTDYLNNLASLISELQLTEFEVLTLIAWQYFRDTRPDFIVMEAGLGGRLDATVLCTPTVTVITTISLDHIELLGPTILDIAKEKSGILKAGVPCFMFDQTPDVLALFEACCLELGCPLHVIPRRGDSYLEINEKLARATIGSLSPQVERELRREAALIPRIGGRLDVIRTNPLVLADAAHNLEGITILAQILKQRNFKGHIWYSATKRPDLEAILAHLLPLTDSLIIFEFDHPRAVKKKDYSAELFTNSRVIFLPISERESFLDMAILDKRQQICLTGSIYFLGEMIPLLRQK